MPFGNKEENEAAWDVKRFTAAEVAAFREQRRAKLTPRQRAREDRIAAGRGAILPRPVLAGQLLTVATIAAAPVVVGSGALRGAGVGAVIIVALAAAITAPLWGGMVSGLEGLYFRDGAPGGPSPAARRRRRRRRLLISVASLAWLLIGWLFKQNDLEILVTGAVIALVGLAAARYRSL